VTGRDRSTQTRRKRIIFHKIEDPFAILKVAGHSDIRLTQTCAHVVAEVLSLTQTPGIAIRYDDVQVTG